MLTIYKNSENGLAVMDDLVNGCWINVIDPTPDEVNRLLGFGIPQDYITYPLDLDERARVERENGELLIVLRVPYFQGESVDVPFATIPLGIILAQTFVVTICRHDNEILRDIFSGKVKGLVTAKRRRFILQLLLVTANRYLSYLRQINKVTEALEDQLQLSTRNKEVLELLKYQKSLTYFTTALKGNELMIERLQRSQIFQEYPEDKELLEDVLIENQQAIDMTNIASNILSSMMDAFASIISNNLNGVMKFLASITIVLSVPNIISSFFGMNVTVPLESHEMAFGIIVGATLLTSLVVIWIFNKRDWF